MNTFTMRRLAAALLLGGSILFTSSAAHGGPQKAKPATKPAASNNTRPASNNSRPAASNNTRPAPARPVQPTRPTQTNNNCRPVGAYTAPNSAFGQLQRMNNIGGPTVNTGNVFEGSRGVRSGVDTTIKPTVDPRCKKR